MSFSNYSGMKACFLKGLPLSCICFSEKPPLFLKSKAQLLGIFLHAMLEKIFELRKYDRSERSNLLKVAFDVELLKFEKQFAEHSWRLGTDSISKLPEIGKIFDQLSQIVFSKNIYGEIRDDKIKIYPEKSLTSKDKCLAGIVDALIESNNERVIVEHKAGEIFEGKFLKNQYYLQVHFYAELVYEEFGEYPDFLSVKSAQGKKWKMRPDIEVAKKLGREARAMLNQYNAKISKKESLDTIAKVSTEACAGCNYQPFCPVYWGNYRRIEMSEKIQGLKLEELAIIEGVSTYKSALKVKIVDGQSKGKVMLIGGFYPKRFANYKHSPGRELMITNLMVSDLNCSARFTETSQIYNIVPGK
jgi:hypothetical protein